MSTTILETAIIIREWPTILEYWPQLKISETLFPPHLKYFNLQLNDDVRLIVYLLDSLSKEEFLISDRIIPYLPFSLLFISALDAAHKRLLKTYEDRYRTPLCFLAVNEKSLRDQIVLRENLATQLSRVFFFNAEDPLLSTWTLIAKNCLENVAIESGKEIQSETLSGTKSL